MIFTSLDFSGFATKIYVPRRPQPHFEHIKSVVLNRWILRTKQIHEHLQVFGGIDKSDHDLEVALVDEKLSQQLKFTRSARTHMKHHPSDEVLIWLQEVVHPCEQLRVKRLRWVQSCAHELFVLSEKIANRLENVRTYIEVRIKSVFCKKRLD